MPTATETQAGITRRPANCTRTAGVFDAGDLAVCRAGDVVALHLGTSGGTFVFRIRERIFIRACRGAADHNGNPFRTIDELKAINSGEVAEFQADAAAVQPVRMSPESPLQTRRDAAWRSLLNNPAQSISDVAADHGLSEGALALWLSKAHRGKLRQLRREAGVSLCPPSRPKNFTQAAASGQPLLKPSGKL